MQKTLLIRFIAIFGLTLALLIPLEMIRAVVSERKGLQAQVERTIAASSSGAQRLAGPLLVVPYTEKELIISTDSKGIETKKWIDHQQQIIFVPTRLRYDGAANIEPKYKGIYKALTYRTSSKWQADFEVPQNLGSKTDPKQIIVGAAFLAIGVTDVRGLNGTPQIVWNNQPLKISNGTNTDGLGDGIRAEAPLVDTIQAKNYQAIIHLDVSGLGAIAFAPLALSTVVNLEANWPHPNFGGSFLPQTKTITDANFKATWDVSHLASRNISMVQKGLSDKNALEIFDVTFAEPANIYQQAERAVKYGILFIVLTFAAFFLIETLKEIRIHPMQHALVGLALAIFFLLLVSLSEHIRFIYAYLVAGSVCVLLISYYLAHVLGGWLRGLAFGLKLTILYGVLYGLLQSEDSALVMGTLLLFVVLSMVMLLTRKLNWYQISSAKTATSAQIE